MSSTRREYEMFFKITGAMGGSFSAAMRNSSSEMKALQTATSRLNSQMRDISGYQKQQKAIERQKEIIRNSETRLTELRRRNAELAQEMTNTANPTKEQRGQLERNAEQIRRCENALEEHNQRLREMQDRLGDARVALQDAGIDTDNLSGDMERLQGRLEEISRTRNFLSNVSEELETTRAQFRDATKEFAGLAGGIGAAVGTVYATASKPAMNFESAFTGVRKTVDATEEEFAEMRQGILDMSQTDVIASADEIAAVAEAAGQLGIQKEHILDFSKVMIDLGEATNLSADEAASELAKFANITQMDQGDFDKLGSVVVDLGNNFATTEADIVSMGMRLASTGELTGLSEPQIMAAATALSSLGIEAEAGGSAMSKILKSLQLAVETGDGLEGFAKVANLSQDAFKQLYKQDSLKALSAFTKGLNDTERNGKSAVAILDDMGITEVRMSNAVLSLASSDDILTDAADLATKAWEENNALTAEAEKRYATTESQIDQAKNSVENLGITIGDMTLPMIKELAGELTEAAKGAQRWVSENQEGIKKVAGIAGEVAKYALILKGTQVTYLGVKTGLLGIEKAFTKVKAARQAAKLADDGKKLSTFASSLTGLTASAAGFTAVAAGTVAALAAIAGAVYLNYQHYQKLRKEYADGELFNNGLPKLKDYTEAVKESTSEHYKYAQEVNEASDKLDDIEYEMSKAKQSVDLYNQILEENGTLTSEQADAMYEPFNTLVSKLEDDFQVRYGVVFDTFKSQAQTAASQLGISVADITGVLEGFKAQFGDSITQSQKVVTDYLGKIRSGDAVTDEDKQAFVDEMQYINEMSDSGKSDALAAYEEQKEALGGMDLGANKEDAIENIQALQEYGKSYLDEIDQAQNNINDNYEELRREAGVMLAHNKMTGDEYSQVMDALDTAQGVAYDDYLTKRSEFVSEMMNTAADLKQQLGDVLLDTVESQGTNIWDNWIGLLAANQNMGDNLQKLNEELTDALAAGDSERAAAIREEMGNAWNGYGDDIIKNAKGNALNGVKSIYQGVSDEIDKLNSLGVLPAVEVPLTVSGKLELLKSGGSTGAKFIPTSALAEMKAAGIPGHANGSSFTENAFIAGENGPELIVGAPGRRVFTADETSMLLGIMPQALSLAAYSRARSTPVNITVNSSFSGSSADYSAYNDDLAEKIYRIFVEKADDERRNAFY